TRSPAPQCFRTSRSPQAVPQVGTQETHRDHRQNPFRRAVTAEYRTALRLVAESLPTGAAVPVPREQLLAILGSEATSSTPQVPDALLQVEQVAERLGVGRQWVYRHKKTLG